MTKTFLELIAADLIKRFGTRLNNVTVVIPGKRASLFLNQQLARLSDTPIWAPSYVSIDELFQRYSPYRKADQIETICHLYKIYASLIPDAESLDEFYGWGEIILADFDDIDKHLAKAHELMANVYEMHALDTDYLSDDEVEALKRFFAHFSRERNTELKERFLRLWNEMPAIYDRLRQEMMQQGSVYSGALQRDVIENHRVEIDPQRHYVFAGFNVLNDTEKALFTEFKNSGQALFYWDYDRFYIENAQCEAGIFMKQNLLMYGSDLPASEFDNLRHLQDVTYVATSTNNAQYRYIPEWLSTNLGQQETDTAIVLCDEYQLQPVLHSLPDQADQPGTPRHVNVTMGFPLTDTPVYSYISALMDLQIDGWDAQLMRFRTTPMHTLTHHPYHRTAFPDASELTHQDSNEALLDHLLMALRRLGASYSHIAQPTIYEQLYIESIFQTHSTITRFRQLLSGGDIQLMPTTLRRLIRQVLGSINTPFHGEPAMGLQVMGVLETRNLDFQHLLMLNVGEGNLPKKEANNSMIPYNLREAFGLTTQQHKICIYAYYFYRLIQRAQHVTMVYNENSSGLTQNEISRFMRQLQAETNIPIRHIRLEAKQKAANAQMLVAEKTPQVMNELHSRFIGEKAATLTPSAINAYLDCPLRFYFQQVGHIYIDDEPEDGITPILFGDIFHTTAELIYKHIANMQRSRVITASTLQSFIDNPEVAITPYLDLVMHMYYFHPISDHEKEEVITRLSRGSRQELILAVNELFQDKSNAYFCGSVLIIRDVLMRYLRQLLAYDYAHAPFTLTALEGWSTIQVNIGTEEAPIWINTGGKIDRLQEKAGIMHVIDYKTGTKSSDTCSMENMFNPDKGHSAYYLQTFLYAIAVRRNTGKPTKPNLFYVSKAHDPEKYDSSMLLSVNRKKESVEDIEPYEEEFMEGLVGTIRNIFDPQKPFVQTEDASRCQYCKYKKICGK